MEAAENDSQGVPQLGRIERALSNPRFQRAFGMWASILGLIFVVFAIAGYILAPRHPGSVLLSWSTVEGSMLLLAVTMGFILALTAGLLGAYLSLRSSRNALARLLGTSCSAMAAGFGLWAFIGNFLAPLAAKSPTVIAALGSGVNGLWIVTMVFALALVIMLLVSVWMFSTLKFILFFPKPIKLAGVDPHATSRDLGERIRERWRNAGIRGVLLGDTEFKLRWLIGPQFIALAAGLQLIIWVDYQADLLSSRMLTDTILYFWCWIPFAFISGKQKHLGEVDQRATRWVTFGQTVWLLIFLGSLMLVLILRGTNLLTFSRFEQSNVFTMSLMTFMFCGFVLVFLVTLAFSILYHGTLDPDLMIRRTWVVALVGIVSGMLFVLIERLLAGMLARWLDISQGAAFTVVGIVTAVCIFPIRAWAEKLIKRGVEKWQSTYLLADGIRQDAVIVFADLSGYTALSEKNEREALILAAIFHRDAEAAAEAHQGRLIKTIGDAVMMRFAKTEDAYAATRKLIDEYAAHAAPLVKTTLPVHAALHRGEVVEGANGDVFGATVNMAARLLGVAGPHEVVASESAIAGISTAIKAEAMGSHAFKNVENAVPFFRLAAA